MIYIQQKDGKFIDYLMLSHIYLILVYWNNRSIYN